MSEQDDTAYVETEVEESKPEPKNRRERRGRKPQRSSRIEHTNFSEVDNPEEQYSLAGEAPGRSRMQQVYEAGALDGYIGTNVFRKEIARLQDDQNAFVAWQAKQDEYIIYQNVEYDEEKQMDKWEPVSYQYYPLTVGQRLGLQKLESITNSLTRAIQTNRPEQALVNRLNEEHQTYKTLDEWAYEKSVELLQEQCARYLRMDVEKEFEISNYADVTLAVASARYAELHVPKLQKTRLPSTSSSAKKSAGIS